VIDMGRWKKRADQYSNENIISASSYADTVYAGTQREFGGSQTGGLLLAYESNAWALKASRITSGAATMLHVDKMITYGGNIYAALYDSVSSGQYNNVFARYRPGVSTGWEVQTTFTNYQRIISFYEASDGIYAGGGNWAPGTYGDTSGRIHKSTGGALSVVIESPAYADYPFMSMYAVAICELGSTMYVYYNGASGFGLGTPRTGMYSLNAGKTAWTDIGNLGVTPSQMIEAYNYIYMIKGTNVLYRFDGVGIETVYTFTNDSGHTARYLYVVNDVLYVALRNGKSYLVNDDNSIEEMTADYGGTSGSTVYTNNETTLYAVGFNSSATPFTDGQLASYSDTPSWQDIDTGSTANYQNID
jgi:hypothetical protein